MAEVLEGELIVKRVPGVVVEQAPQTTRIALQLIQDADPVELRVDGNRVIVGGGQAAYRVTGWDAVPIRADRRKGEVDGP